MGWKTISFSLKSHLKEFPEVKHFLILSLFHLLKIIVEGRISQLNRDDGAGVRSLWFI